MESKTEREVEFHKVQHKIAKRDAKEVLGIAKNNVYESLDQKLSGAERMRSSN